MQTVVYTDKGVVHAHRAKLYGYIIVANRVSDQSTYAALKEAEASLNKAKSLFEALRDFGYLDDVNSTTEDINRIDAKIQDITEHKRMKDMIRRH